MIGELFAPHPRLDAAAVPPGAGRVARAWAVLHTLPDPEVPAISLCDLGIVREVAEADGGSDGDGESASLLHVVLTPTYSGCPATELIATQVHDALVDEGLGPVRVSQRLAPAWTTDWLSDTGRERLRAYGIAPPGPARADGAAVVHWVARGVHCPLCGSARTERLSAFGSTPCKSLYRCLACREPFDHFKPI